MDEMKLQRAVKVYQTLCDALDAEELKYSKQEDALKVTLTMSGDDLDMNLAFTVVADREVVVLRSYLPFHVPDDKRMELAAAVSIINDNLVAGCFEYDIRDGELRYRLTNSYCDSEVSLALFKYMLLCVTNTVDEYDDKLFLLIKDAMTLEQLAHNDEE